MCYCFNKCNALTGTQKQRGARRHSCWWSGDGEVKSRARTHYPGDPVTLTWIWLRSTAARRIMAFARLWNSLPICRDFSKVVLLWSTSLAYRIYKHGFQFTGETQDLMQNRCVSRTVPCFRQKGDTACFIQGKVLNEKARETWIWNIIQSMLKGTDTKSLLA